MPLLAQVARDGRAVPVLVVPARPGWNLVHVGAERAEVRVGGRSVRAESRSAATGSWAVVRLPAGRGRLVVDVGDARAAVRFDTGVDGASVDLRGGDGAECAAWALGRVLGDVREPVRACPADELTSADAAALRALTGFIARRGARAIAVTADGSPRGARAEAEVRAAAARLGLGVTADESARVPRVVVAGWSGAAGLVRRVGSGAVPASGVYLAPWLLDAELLDPPAGQLVPLRFDPAGAEAVRYAARLHEAFPGEPATAAGFAGWSRGTSAAPVRLYAASPMGVPGSLGLHAHGFSGRWLPQGTIVPVSGPLRP